MQNKKRPPRANGAAPNEKQASVYKQNASVLQGARKDSPRIFGRDLTALRLLLGVFQ